MSDEQRKCLRSLQHQTANGTHYLSFDSLLHRRDLINALELALRSAEALRDLTHPLAALKRACTAKDMPLALELAINVLAAAHLACGLKGGGCND